MDYYVKIDGGIGRCVAATGAVDLFAKKQAEQGNKVFVVTGLPFVFEGLESVERVYPIDAPFLYEDHILKGEFLEPEPYNNSKYYKEEKHLASVFNYLLNGVDEFVEPFLTLNENELASGKEFVKNKRNGKKVLLLQPWGLFGGRQVGPEEIAEDESFRSLKKDFVKKLVEDLKEEYTILVVKDRGQAGFKDTEEFSPPNIRGVFSAIPFVDAIICCDSFLHHAAAALKTKAKVVVLWGGTSEKNLGYVSQENIRKNNFSEMVFEPNRIPHDHSYYVKKNKGCNDFGEKEEKKVKKALEEKVK